MTVVESKLSCVNSLNIPTNFINVNRKLKLIVIELELFEHYR